MLSHLYTTAFSTSFHHLSALWIRLFSSCSIFQKQHPCFIGGIYWFAGIFAHKNPICCAFLVVALHPFIPKRCLKTLIFYFCCFGYPLLSPFPVFNIQHPTGLSKVKVTKGQASGFFFIKKMSKHSYSSTALSLTTEDKQTYQNHPCSIISKIPLNEQKVYYLQGTVSRSSCPTTFRVSKLINSASQSPFSQIQNFAHSLPSIKENVRLFLHQQLLNVFLCKDISQFSSSLILGTPLSYKQKELFKSKGLSHLFSVSGWHFSLFANTLFFLLKTVTPKTRNLFVLFLLSLLNLVFPTSPSVFRTWFSSILFCLTPFSVGSCSSLNRLGISFILCSLFFPLSSPALILSFLATLGILLFFAPLMRFFYYPWTLLFKDHWFLFPLRFLFTSLSISLSAQLFILFPVIRMFKTFPLDGLIYNLFYPTLVMPIFLLVPLSFFNSIMARFSESYISWILNLSLLHSPNFFISLSLRPLALEWITLFSILLFYLGAFLSIRRAYNPWADYSVII